jgi:hypothetical protein
LAENLRGKIEPVRQPLTDAQTKILNAVIDGAGEGRGDTLGLRLVLAASKHPHAAAWPIGILARALEISGRKAEGMAVRGVAWGCRLSRYGEVASSTLQQFEAKHRELGIEP